MLIIKRKEQQMLRPQVKFQRTGYTLTTVPISPPYSPSKSPSSPKYYDSEEDEYSETYGEKKLLELACDVYFHEFFCKDECENVVAPYVSMDGWPSRLVQMGYLEYIPNNNNNNLVVEEYGFENEENEQEEQYQKEQHID